MLVDVKWCKFSIWRSYFLRRPDWLIIHDIWLPLSIMLPVVCLWSQLFLTAFALYDPNFFFFLVGLKVKSAFISWVIIEGLVPFILALDQAKVETLSLNFYKLLLNIFGKVCANFDNSIWIVFVDADLHEFFLLWINYLDWITSFLTTKAAFRNFNLEIRKFLATFWSPLRENIILFAFGNLKHL